MTDTSEHPTSTVTADPPPPRVPPPHDHDRSPNRLAQFALGVAIVAGIVFIVAVVFFSGFFIGIHSGGAHHRGGHDGGMHMFHRGGPPPMGQLGPGMQTGPGSAGNTPTPAAPATPTPSR